MPNHQTVPSFETVEQLQSALNAKANFAPVDLYPRDGTCLLSEVESKCAELAGVEDHELIVFNSGMAAVITALETYRNQNSVIACAEQSYSQTANYIQNTLARRGNKVVYFDAGDIASIDCTLKRHTPDIILSETVCNGPDIGVLDVNKLLGLDSFRTVNPHLILDNTLPLSTTRPLNGVLEVHTKTIVVESGTKSYTYNQELCGLAYTKDPELLELLRQRRRTTGCTPNVAAIEKIDTLLPNKDVFDQRNLNIFECTGKLALACFNAQPEELLVSHPYISEHPNHCLATRNFWYGNSPVFFLQCIGDQDQFETARQLWSHPDVQDECELGQSFGFDKTRILPDAIFPAIRIAGGSTTDTAKLSRAFAEVLSG